MRALDVFEKELNKNPGLYGLGEEKAEVEGADEDTPNEGKILFESEGESEVDLTGQKKKMLKETEDEPGEEPGEIEE